jgi:hypothetical protein
VRSDDFLDHLTIDSGGEKLAGWTLAKATTLFE